MKKVAGLMGGGGSKRQAAAARADQQVNIARQQQESAGATANSAEQLGKVRRTPRGRRLLLSDASKLG